MRDAGKGQSINNNLGSETETQAASSTGWWTCAHNATKHQVQASSDRLVVTEKQGVEAGVWSTGR